MAEGLVQGLVQNAGDAGLFQPAAVPVPNHFAGGVCGSGRDAYSQALAGLLEKLSPVAVWLDAQAFERHLRHSYIVLK